MKYREKIVQGIWSNDRNNLFPRFYFGPSILPNFPNLNGIIPHSRN